MKKRLFFVFLFLFLVGCGHVKNSKEIVRWVKSEYGISSEVIATQKDDSGANYFVMRDKERNITFNCHSSMSPISIDGSHLGSVESSGCDYYDVLTNLLAHQIEKIGYKYNVKFIRDEGRKLINMIEIPQSDEKNIGMDDLVNATNAFNELTKLYNFKKIPDYNYLNVFICLYNSHELTKYYFEYTKKGANGVLYDSNTEFYKRNSIPLRIEQDIIDYADLLYGDGFEIIDFQLIRSFQSEYDYDIIIYVLSNSKLGLLKELGINIEKYREDYKKDFLKSIDNYYIENYKAYWWKHYEFN